MDPVKPATRASAATAPRGLSITLALIAVLACAGCHAWALFTGPGNFNGDAPWYLGVARALHDGVWPPDDVVSPLCRPIGFPALLALLMTFTGSANEQVWPLVVALNSLAFGLAVWLVGRIVLRLLPVPDGERRSWWPPIAAALLVALNHNFSGPLTGRLVFTEHLVVALVVGFALACLRLHERHTIGRSVVAALLGAAMLHVRVDLAPLVVVGLAVVWWLDTSTATTVRRRALAPVLALLLLLPSSLVVSLQVGRPVFVTATSLVGGSYGLLQWGTALSVSPDEWQRITWFAELEDDELERALADHTPEQRERALDLLRRHRESWSHDVEAGLMELARERMYADPLRYWIGLPLWRGVRLWWSEQPIADDDPLLGLKRVWFAACTPLVFAAFVASLWVLVSRLRRPDAMWLLAAIVVMRTFSIVGAGMLTGYGLYETRYLECVQPLAIVLLVLLAASVARTMLSRRSAPPASPAPAALPPPDGT
ncbi:MAG: hypothetical protein AB7K09_02990 [Planctomycetota bacterium]